MPQTGQGADVRRDGFQSFGGVAVFAALRGVPGVVNRDGVGQGFDLVGFDAGQNVLWRRVVVAGREPAQNAARGGEDFIEGITRQRLADVIRLAQGGGVAGEFALGRRLNRRDDADEREARGGFLRGHRLLGGARAGQFADVGVNLSGQRGDLRGQRGVEIHSCECVGVGGIDGGGGDFSGVGEFIEMRAVDGATGAFRSGRGSWG